MAETLHIPSNGELALYNAEQIIQQQLPVIERIARITAPETLADPARKREDTEDPGWSPEQLHKVATQMGKLGVGSPRNRRLSTLLEQSELNNEPSSVAAWIEGGKARKMIAEELLITEDTAAEQYVGTLIYSGGNRPLDADEQQLLRQRLVERYTAGLRGKKRAAARQAAMETPLPSTEHGAARLLAATVPDLIKPTRTTLLPITYGSRAEGYAVTTPNPENEDKSKRQLERVGWRKIVRTVVRPDGSKQDAVYFQEVLVLRIDSEKEAYIDAKDGDKVKQRERSPGPDHTINIIRRALEHDQTRITALAVVTSATYPSRATGAALAGLQDPEHPLPIVMPTYGVNLLARAGRTKVEAAAPNARQLASEVKALHAYVEKLQAAVQQARQPN